MSEYGIGCEATRRDLAMRLRGRLVQGRALLNTTQRLPDIETWRRYDRLWKMCEETAELVARLEQGGPLHGLDEDLFVGRKLVQATLDMEER